MGFGKDEEDQKVMNFKTTIATSVWVLGNFFIRFSSRFFWNIHQKYRNWWKISFIYYLIIFIFTFHIDLNIHWKFSEKAVSHLNPILGQRPVLTVRELFLQDNNPKLDRELCRYYIETYERARFSKDEFTLGEYQIFVTRWVVVMVGANWGSQISDDTECVCKGEQGASCGENIFILYIVILSPHK